MKTSINSSRDLIAIIEDKKISIALMSLFIILTVQYFIFIFFNLFESGTGLKIQLISKGLVGVMFIYALPSVLKKSTIKAIGIYIFTIFLFLINFIIFPENTLYLKRLIFPFFFMSLPAFIFTLSIEDFTIFRTMMKISSYIVFVFGFLIGISVFLGRTSVGIYSISLSYYMLLPALIFLDELMDKFSFRPLLLTVLSMFIIIALGSRGAILCIIVYVSLKFIRPNSKMTYKSILKNLSILCFGIFSIIYIDRLMMSLYKVLFSFGINSRTLSLFLRENLYLSGRERIYEIIIEEIKKYPIIGVGLAGDMRITGGSYVHNFFLEILTNFGLIAGGFVIILLIFLVISSLFTKNTSKYNNIIIWMCLGFVHLLVSSSYLIDFKFWIFLGLIIKHSVSKNIKVKTYE